MSRFEGDLTAAAETELSKTELLGLVGKQDRATQKRQAIACYLSAGEGWHEAMKALGGAFASDAAEAVRLSGGKAE